MTPPSMFLFCCKIKTDALDVPGYFVFMYPRSSSRELQDTPSFELIILAEEQNRTKTYSHLLQYFTQRPLYDFYEWKSSSLVREQMKEAILSLLRVFSYLFGEDINHLKRHSDLKFPYSVYFYNKFEFSRI